MKSIRQFNGDKEGYSEWYRTLKVDLLQKGLYSIVTNQKPRPLDITPEMWHFNMDQQAQLTILNNKVLTSQEKWDVDNGKAYATIISSLTEALQKRYDAIEEPDSDNAHWLIMDLNARYGGAYDPKVIAMFLLESQKPIMPNTRFENWSADWENLHRKMGNNPLQHSVHLLASMKLVLAASGSNEGERFYASLSFAENSNYDYIATRDHLIRQDKLLNSSNIFNTSAVSFGENDIRRVDNDSQREYHEWKRNTSRFQGRSRNFENDNQEDNNRYRNSRDYSRNDDRHNREDRNSFNNENNNRGKSNRDDQREVSRGRNSSVDRYSRRNSNKNNRDDVRDRSNSQSSADSRVSRDSRDRTPKTKDTNNNQQINSGRKQSENTCFNFLDGKCIRGDNCRYSHNEKINLSVESPADRFKKEWIQSISLQIDSGAAKSITGNLSSLEQYSEFSEPKLMYTITGSRISVLGMGKIGMIPTYYSPDADSGVIATKDLQRKGMMTIFPPGENSGVWIVDPTSGAVIIQGDRHYNIQPSALSKLSSAGNNNDLIEISPYSLEKSHGYRFKTSENELDFEDYKIQTAKSKMTIFDKTISYRVADIQRSYGYPSIQSLLGYCRSIENFPITEKDIRKYFVNFPHYQLGHITRKSFTSAPTLHTEALKIGDIVSTDCIKFSDHGCGPGGVQLFLDKKTQYAIGILTKNEGNAQQLSECFNNVKNFYASYNHTITLISGDSLPAYRSQEYESNISDQQSRRQESAPREQQQNEIERFVRNIEEGVTAMKVSASWVPLKLIAFVIMLWICLWNLQEGSVPGISRYEEFTKRRPAADAGARPGTYGDCYIVNKQKDERKGGHFGEGHGDIVMYLSPNSQSKDAHWFYKPETDRVISRRSYDRASGIPSEWLNGKRDSGAVRDEDGNKWDFINGPQQYDVWHLGATSEAVALDPNSKFPLASDIVLSQPTSLNELVSQYNQTELQPLEAGVESFENSIILIDVPGETSSLQEVTTTSEEVSASSQAIQGEESVSSRTRSTGPSEGLSIKSINDNLYYGLSSQQIGKSLYILFLIFFLLIGTKSVESTTL